MEMKKILMILLIPVVAVIKLQGQNNQETEESNAGIIDRTKEDKQGNVVQVDTTFHWSWSWDGPLEEDVKEHLKWMQESIRSFNWDHEFHFSVPKDFQLRFDSLMDGRGFDTNRLKELIADLKANSGQFKNLEKDLKDFFEDEENQKIWKEFHDDKLKKLEHILKGFGLHEIENFPETKELITL